MANRYWLCSQLTLSTDAGWTTGCGCSLTGDENELTWNPHPTEFSPYSEVKIDGDGDGTGLGYVNFKWTSGDGILTAQQWNYLMGFFSGNEPTADVCVRTRTDTIAANALGAYEYEYKWYFAKMHRPKATPHPSFRFRDVEILFTHAEEV